MVSLFDIQQPRIFPRKFNYEDVRAEPFSHSKDTQPMKCISVERKLEIRSFWNGGSQSVSQTYTLWTTRSTAQPFCCSCSNQNFFHSQNISNRLFSQTFSLFFFSFIFIIPCQHHHPNICTVQCTPFFRATPSVRPARSRCGRQNLSASFNLN